MGQPIHAAGHQCNRARLDYLTSPPVVAAAAAAAADAAGAATAVAATAVTAAAAIVAAVHGTQTYGCTL